MFDISTPFHFLFAEFEAEQVALVHVGVGDVGELAILMRHKTILCTSTLPVTFVHSVRVLKSRKIACT